MSAQLSARGSAAPPAPSYTGYAAALRGRSLPAAFVDLDLLRENARTLVRRAGGKPLRVASRSVRSVQLLELVLREVPGVHGVLCFSAREAAFLAGRGLTDLLVAYPTVDAGGLAEVCQQLAKGALITLAVDCAEHVRRAGEAARAAGVAVPLCIDVDMSSSYPGLHFGVRRSPLREVREVVALARTAASTPGVRLEGVIGYEAQIAGVQDAAAAQGPRNAVIRLLKERSFSAVVARRTAVVKALAREGFSLRFVNGGGTGSLERTREDPSVTELAAGSGLFAPALFDGYRDFRHLPAAGFALPICRIPAPGLFTALGGGYVASGAAGPDRLPQPYLPEGMRLLPHEGAGEVQTPLAYGGPQPLGLGDPVFFRHAKAGELCEHFNTLVLLSEGRVVGEALTYRGEGRCFP
ncbi:MAG: amino acid deaminase/aldolase [Myxococcaceae bacterium]|nr:amino acid deaminase/aldolase [Myxococcaceae bacterium]MCI0670364.1 amino acid deaminase/aldolase [Myxococcaceae bacterium]